MKTKALIFISLLPVAISARSQDSSSSFFPMKEGTMIEMTNYNKAGIEQGKNVTTVLSVKKTTTGTLVKLKSESDARNSGPMEYTAKCDGKSFSISMKSFIPASMQRVDGGSEMTVDAGDLIYPNSLSVGDRLNDGMVTLNVTMGTMTMKTVINIRNRVVTGKETLKTKAGTYDCFKIEYDIETTGMSNMKIMSKVKQWVAKGVGTVKSETYNTKGELTGYSQLTYLK